MEIHRKFYFGCAISQRQVQSVHEGMKQNPNQFLINSQIYFCMKNESNFIV